MLDFLTFVLENITATAERKQELKVAFAKQIGWTEKIKDENGKEIDNPVSFEEAFNKSIWEHIRQTCVAGQQKLDKEAAKPDDDFKDLLG